MAGCSGRDDAAAPADEGPQLKFILAGKLQSKRLDETSGIQAGFGGVFYAHSDEGGRVFVLGPAGEDLGSFEVTDAGHRDWEDITRVPRTDGGLLVLGDIGDNHALRSQLSLYFVREPAPGESTASRPAFHRLRFHYPDGPRDAESLAYDSAGERLLILTKRDKPPRLYAIPLDLALWNRDVEAEFLGEVPGFRPPTRADFLRNPGRGLWVSQPTGMDISPDGRLAAVITYRSLYLFERVGDETWPEAMQRAPREVVGPPGSEDEAVGFSLDGRSIYVTGEDRPAGLYRLDLP